MCYDIKASLHAQLKRARQYGNEEAIKEIEEKLIALTDLPIHHRSGFSHPKLLIYTKEALPMVARWGLVPHWVKDEVQMKQIWNKTLNARGETMFDKPSFRSAAMHGRCLIYIDGFYEHHHRHGKTFPYFIYPKDKEPMILGGLYSHTKLDSGEEVTSFTIVTTKGNTMMSGIHNNPKLKGPRMPLILDPSSCDSWLLRIDDELDQLSIQHMVQAYPDDALDAHTVGQLRGSKAFGNIPTAYQHVSYPELRTLFD